MNTWFVSKQGKLNGPFSLPQLKAMVQAGDLKAADMVCAEGGAPTKASRIPGLFAEATAPVNQGPTMAARQDPRPAHGEPEGSPDPDRPAVMSVVGVLGGIMLLIVLSVGGLGAAWMFSRETKEPTPIAQVVVPPVEPLTPDPTPVVEPKIAEPPKAKEPAMSPKVKAAVEHGAAHLKKRLLEKSAPLGKDKRFASDTEAGSMALAGLALLEAKVPPDDPAIRSTLTVVREAGPQVRLVYALGAMLFFLNRLHDLEPLGAGDLALVRSLALRIVAGQVPSACWTYQNPPISLQAEEELLQKLRTNNYRPEGNLGKAYASHSMTQFALLALWGSARHNIPVRPALLASAAHFQQTQALDGTWGYQIRQGDKTRRDSNTCAGLIALAMEQTLREDKRFRGQANDDTPVNPKLKEQRDKAFAHLAKVIGHPKNEPPGKLLAKGKLVMAPQGKIIRAEAWGDLYFLWCLERVAVIYDLKTIGGKDWYAWGSEVILESQRPDGSWLDLHGDVNDTSFAILFLTRANLAKDLTESIRTRGGMVIAD